SGAPRPIGTSSTATSAVRIVDLAVRASGALVASVVRELGPPGLKTIEGVLVEVDAPHAVATVFRRLGAFHASRIAIDRDEALVAILATGAVEATAREERL